MQSAIVGNCILKNLKLVSLQCFKNRKCTLLFNADHPMQDTSSKNDLDFFGRNINIPSKNIRTKSLARTS